MNDHEHRVDQAIAEYLTAAAAGAAPPREQFLAQHPDLAPRLAAFLDDHEKMDQVLRQQEIDPAFAPTLAPEEKEPADNTLGRVRYFGDYELLEEIARGGMGVIFRARQVSLNREVALKMILAGQLASPAEIQRFRTEAEAAANLDHPHILPIYEVGSHDGQHYFSMKLIDGGNLADHLPELRRRPRLAVSLLARCARAVQFAHERGVLHRDLKPANILIDRAGLPYLSDFGLARKVEGDSRLTQSGAIVGSPNYMAPEQARAEKQLTTAADVYALGAILYELLTGQPPFRGPTVLDTVMQVIEKEPAPPRQLNPRADADLSIIALKCLEKEPGRRSPSAAALADDLERWLAGEPIQARPVSTLERVRKWGRRNPALAASLAGVLALMIWGLILLAWLLHQTEQREHEAQAAAQAARAAAEREAGLRQLADRARAEAEAAARQATEERRGAERLLYFHRIALAQQYWRSDGIEQTRKLLEVCAQEHRHWEWRYLERLLQAELLKLPGNGQFTRRLAVSSDGTRLAAFADTGDAGVRVWDLRTNITLCEVSLSSKQRSFSAGDLSRDGQTLVLGDRQGRIALWDANSGQFIKELKPLSGEVKYLRFSEDGAWLLIQGAGRPELRVVATDAPRPLPAEATEVWQFSPDGRWLLGRRRNPQLFVPNSAQQYQTMVWNAQTMDQGQVLGFVSAWDFSSDGKRLVLAGSDLFKPPFLKVVEVGTWTELMQTEIASVGDVGFSPDGKFITIAEWMNRPIHVHDAATGRRLRTLRGHEGFVNGLQFHPDGRLFSCSWDNTIRAWDVAQDQEVRVLSGNPLPVISAAAFQPQGHLLACVGGDNMFSGLRLFGGARELQVVLWDAQAGRAARKLTRHREGARRVSFSANGVYLISGGRDGLAAVWRVADGQQLGAMKHPGWIEGVALSPDGKWAASTHEPKEVTDARFNRGPWREVPGEVRLWDAATGQQLHLLTGHKTTIYHVAFSPDGARLATLSYGQLRLWNTQTGALVKEVTQNTLASGQMAFQPDGKMLVIASRGGLQWWEPETGKLLGVTEIGGDHYNPVLTFSIDGQRLFASFGNIVKVWDTATRQEIMTLPSTYPERIAALGFTPEGWLFGLTSNGRVMTWPIASAP
jgi:WD40 repeat protein